MPESVDKTVEFKRPSDQPKHWSLRDTGLLILLMVLGLGLRLWNVTNPAEKYFDEIYYVDAGEKLWSGQPDPNSVHPPLGKWMIALGIEGSKAVLGPDVNEMFSWRIASVLAGTLMVGVVYCFGLMLFEHNPIAAAAAATVIATEHLHLSMSRIAMLDPFLALFCLIGAWWSFAYFMGGHERWGVLGAFSLGLATGCKWSGLLTAFGCFLAVLYLDYNRRQGDFGREYDYDFTRSQRYFFWLLLLIPLGFFLTYFHLFRLEGLELDTFKKIFSQGDRMVRFRYNTEEFTHNYKSQFWEWPLVLRPIWLYYKQIAGQVIGVCSLGVWTTWWAFTALLIARTVRCFLQRTDFVTGALILLWLGQWLPWCISTTGGFFYYMLPEIPIMALMLGKWFSDLYRPDDALGEERWRAWLLAAVYLVGFALYYPFAAGLSVPNSYFRALFFLPEWI